MCSNMVIDDNQHRNECNNWQSRLVVNKYMTTLMSRPKCPFLWDGSFCMMHYHHGVTCYIPSHECSAFWCALLSPQLASLPLHSNTSHRGFLDCAHWMWTWFSGYICFGVSAFIVKLYMIYVYFNIKLDLYWIEEISVIISLSKVIRNTMLVTIRVRYGLVRLGPIFWKNRVFWPLRFLRQNNKMVPISSLRQ